MEKQNQKDSFIFLPPAVPYPAGLNVKPSYSYLMTQTYKNCQSCGMPLKKDPGHGGTEANGSRSIRFCSKCYQHGKFTSPDITLEQMQALVKGKLKEMGFPGFLAGMLTKGIPRLERWRSSSW